MHLSYRVAINIKPYISDVNCSPKSSMLSMGYTTKAGFKSFTLYSHISFLLVNSNYNSCFISVMLNTKLTPPKQYLSKGDIDL